MNPNVDRYRLIEHRMNGKVPLVTFPSILCISWTNFRNLSIVSLFLNSLVLVSTFSSRPFFSRHFIRTVNQRKGEFHKQLNIRDQVFDSPQMSSEYSDFPVFNLKFQTILRLGDQYEFRKSTLGISRYGSLFPFVLYLNESVMSFVLKRRRVRV